MKSAEIIKATDDWTSFFTSHVEEKILFDEIFHHIIGSGTFWALFNIIWGHIYLMFTEHTHTHTLIGIKLIYLPLLLLSPHTHVDGEITHRRMCVSTSSSSGTVVVFIRWQSSLILWLYLTTLARSFPHAFH